MTLKRQLLIVAALTLLIPLAGVQFVLQLEQALRAQELSRLSDQALRVAGHLEATLDENPAASPNSANPDNRRTLFAGTLTRRLILDGYGDDWPNRPGLEGEPLLYTAGEHVHWRAGQDRDHLWLFLRFPGLKPAFSQPGADQPQTGASPPPTNAKDRLIISWRTPGGILQEFLVAAQTAGRAQVLTYGSPQAENHPPAGTGPVQAVWQTQSDGFSVELQLPRLAPGSQIGFSLEHAPDGGPARSFGTLGRLPREVDATDAGQDLPRLLLDQPATAAILTSFVSPGQSLILISPEGWELARADAALSEQTIDVTLFSPLELLQQAALQGLRLLLSANQDRGPQLAPDGALWQGSPLQQIRQASSGLLMTNSHQPGETPALTAMVAVGSGPDRAYLVSRRSTDALLSLSSATLGEVLARSMLLMLTLVLVLVGYASWLSWRITRLQRAVSGVFDSEGRVSGLMPRSRARDELGDLSRHFAQLVGQVRGYTLYLESFASKLSHELKTPLAVMRSSLDNLSHTQPSDEQTVYLSRANAGGERLSRILTAMSAATRLERSLTRTEKEPFDLASLLAMASAGYQSLDNRVRYQGLDGPCLMWGAPDLLVQALDKLVENARDFTPVDGGISITLQAAEKNWIVSVCNDGPPLPEQMSEHLFASFVSVRAPGADHGHLGQGLVIVKLVADFHHARAVAENRGDDGGVCFRLYLPRRP